MTSSTSLRRTRRLLALVTFAVLFAALSPAGASAQQGPTRTVIAVDVSGSMGQGGRIDLARSGARDIVAKRSSDEQIALVTFGEKTRVVVPFTVDAAVLGRGIDALTLDGSTALWDAVRLGTQLLSAQPSTRHRLIVFSDGDDTVSATTFDQARVAVANSRTIVSVIALPGSTADGGRLGALARESGGQFTHHTALDTTRQAPPANKAWNPLGGSGKWVAIGSTLVAALLLAAGLLLLLVRRESMVDRALAPYSGSHHASDDDDTSSAFVQTAFLKRAVAMTARLAASRGFLARIEGDLERADLPIRAAELVFVALIVIAMLGVAVLVIAGSFIMALFAVGFAMVAPLAVVRFVGARKRRKFVSQLPDTLKLASGALRAGFSFLQAMETVSAQMHGPMGKELRRIIAETRLGRELEDSMEETARRMSSDDFDWVVMAVRVQREVGGNLAEIFDNVSETMVARERLRRDISALTAEGRISMVILGVMPIALAMFLYVVNPEYIRLLWTESVGKVMAGGSAILAAFGIWWMKKTTEIEL